MEQVKHRTIMPLANTSEENKVFYRSLIKVVAFKK